MINREELFIRADTILLYQINDASWLLRSLQCIPAAWFDFWVPYYQTKVKPTAPPQDNRGYGSQILLSLIILAKFTYSDIIQ